MLNYIIRRLLLIIPTLFGLSMLLFFILSIGGGVAGALERQLGDMEPAKKRIQMNYIKTRYGLEKPLIVQYGRWLNQISPIGYEVDVNLETNEPEFSNFGFKSPDFGRSFSKNIPVGELISNALPITLMINVITLPLVYLITIVSGVYMARHKGGVFDLISGITYLALWSVPTILAGVLLLGFFASVDYLQIFPSGGLHDTQAGQMSFLPSSIFVKNALTWLFIIFGAATCLSLSFTILKWGGSRRINITAIVAGIAFCIGLVMYFTVHNYEAQTVLDKGWLVDTIWHLILPVICLGYGSLAFISKLMRSSLLDALSSDYIRTARAKGVSSKNILWAHAFRNSLIPLITVAAFFLPALLGGSIVVEKIFAIPGMGTLLIDSIVSKDREVVLSLALMNGLIMMISILIADICYAIADPRVTYD